MDRESDRGVVLVYVLVILALTSTLVVAMVGLSEGAVRRAQRYDAAGQAQALIAAGEASVLAALRRDAETAPEVDHAGEPWGRLGQAAIEIEGGRFAVQIADAQGLYNLNSVAAGGVLAQQRAQAMALAAGLAPATAARLVLALADGRPLRRLEDLAVRVGMSDSDLQALAALVTVLPRATLVNLNSAPAPVLAVLLNNPAQVRLLLARRERLGFLTPLDVTASGVILPPGVSLRSDYFHLRVSVQIGDTVQAGDSLIQRQTDAEGHPAPVVIGRENALAGRLPPGT